jgi:hypothetical protein
MSLPFKILVGGVLGALMVLFFVLTLLTPFVARFGQDALVRGWIRRNVPAVVLRQLKDVGKDDEYLCWALVKWSKSRLWICYATGIGVVFATISILGMLGKLRS